MTLLQSSCGSSAMTIITDLLTFSCFHLSLCSAAAAVCWVLLSHTNLNSLQLLVHSRCLVLFQPSKLFIKLMLCSVSYPNVFFSVTITVFIVVVDFI